MATIPEIREAIAARLETLPALRVTQEWSGPFNVSGTASVAVVEKGPTIYDSVMDGQGDEVAFKVTVLASKASDRAGRAKLDAFCDPTDGSSTSVRAALNGPLGGVVAFARVAADSEYQKIVISDEPGEEYLGVEFTVVVAT